MQIAQDEERMRRMPLVQRILYKKFFYKVPPELLLIKEKEPKMPWWIDFVFFGLAIGYCTFCIFYVLAFTATKGSAVSQAWLSALLFANIQAIAINDPIRCAFMFIILPTLAYKLVTRVRYLLDDQAALARYRWKLLAEHVRLRNQPGRKFSSLSIILHLTLKLHGENFLHTPINRAWFSLGMLSVVDRLIYEPKIIALQAHIRRHAMKII